MPLIGGQARLNRLEALGSGFQEHISECQRVPIGLRQKSKHLLIPPDHKLKLIPFRLNTLELRSEKFTALGIRVELRPSLQMIGHASQVVDDFVAGRLARSSG